MSCYSSVKECSICNMDKSIHDFTPITCEEKITKCPISQIFTYDNIIYFSILIIIYCIFSLNYNYKNNFDISKLSKNDIYYIIMILLLIIYNYYKIKSLF